MSPSRLWHRLCLAILLLQSFALAALLTPTVPGDAVYTPSVQGLRRDGGHGHHKANAQPQYELNETEVLMYHQVTPPSYYTFDWEGENNSQQTHPGYMIGHAVFMSLAFFGALPTGIILRSVKHPAHGLAMIAFYALSALGVATSAIYRKLTPNMYEGSTHSKHGYFVLLIATILSGLDIIRGFQRLVQFVRGDQRTLRRFWRVVILNQDDDDQRGRARAGYTGLVVDTPEEYHYSKETPLQNDDVSQEEDQWANEISRRVHHVERTSMGHQSRSDSEDTLREDPLNAPVHPKGNLLTWLGRMSFIVAERTLVMAGLAQTISGIVIYTGGCRQNWINGCLAHLIKGGIFWSYGLLTFARFLGAFADRGWAWNRAPRGETQTAEWTESFVIFLYGITNTWMERFGAKAGDPFTTKEIQHISIAVMFWFAGLLGMGIESRKIRGWLASSTFASGPNSNRMSNDAVTEPPSYLGSFNPFPALVIGVTGAAMAAHYQAYVFQVQIHQLWGNLLVGFSVLRCLTYFFLWLVPVKSILPSRPPTEALGSFFLACGGLVFMFSTEEITIAAMRRGRDDVMMFLNVAVAVTCLAFCWTLCLIGLKGYLKSRTHTNITYRSSNSTP